ncbi:hypothetical protein [Burkholderia territorii]|uniref:hypothetical protein n=1 Tax=Burkholderia territorii TaxID=1503055 RepID=UPI0012D952E5|nr:hypothetical protein [Burkholderia territorii]
MAIHELLREWPFSFFPSYSINFPFDAAILSDSRRTGSIMRNPLPHGRQREKACTIHIVRSIGAFDAPGQIQLKQFVSMAPGVRAYP